MLLHETILCAATPTTGPGAIAIHDLQTGSTLASFKQTNAAVHGTAVVESHNGQGGILLAAQHDKSILNVYNFQKVRSKHPFLPPGFLFPSGPNQSQNSLA
jgi:pre-rRNA-processing protein IPI3